MKAEILESIRLRPGMESVPEALLTSMIEDCEEELRNLLNYEDTDVLPQRLQSTVKELVFLKYNRDGAQGIQTEAQSSGGSVTYLEDIPKSIKRQIYRYRKLRR